MDQELTARTLRRGKIKYSNEDRVHKSEKRSMKGSRTRRKLESQILNTNKPELHRTKEKDGRKLGDTTNGGVLRIVDQGYLNFSSL